jgi:hypothetical protein
LTKSPRSVESENIDNNEKNKNKKNKKDDNSQEYSSRPMSPRLEDDDNFNSSNTKVNKNLSDK